MKKASLNDIAKSLNVSKTLVSFVLNEQGHEKGISAETCKKVKEKALELDYRPNHIARGLRLGKSQTIGLIVADISNKFYSRIAKKIEEVANQNNYNLIFCSSDENPEKEVKLINMLRERQVDGLIISTTQSNTSLFTRLKKEKYPFVLIDRKLPKLSTNFAGVDNFTGAYQATECLVNNGYKKIGLLKISPEYLSTIKDRESGYRSALKNKGIRVNNQHIRTIDCAQIKSTVRSVLFELTHPQLKIDSIFSTNNNITVACIEYLNEANLRIPQDIAIISFDDIDVFRFCCPTITAVAQPVSEIGEKAVNILLDEINGLVKDKHQEVLPVRLIERNSCGKTLNHVNNSSKISR